MIRSGDILRTVLIAAIMVMQSASATRAGDSAWPQFRGPKSSGLAAEGQNPPVKFGPRQNLLWKTPLPRGHSSPCIWEDQIFLTGYTKEKKELQVFCIGRSSGKILWTRIVPAEQIEKVHSISNPATATPATDGERVYAYFGSYGLLCYDFEGNTLWTVPLPIPKTTFNFGTGTSPIVSGELVILNSDEQNDPHLLGVDRRSGKTVWRQPQPPAVSALSAFGATSYSTPVVWGRHLVIHRRGEVVAYAAENGVRAWSVSAVTNGVSTPVVGNDVLYVGTWSNLGEPDLRIGLPDFSVMLERYDKNGDMKVSKEEFPGDLAVSRRPEAIGSSSGGEVYVKPYLRMVDMNRDDLIDEAEWKRAFSLLAALSQEHGLVAIKPGGKGDITATHILWQETRNVPEVPSPLYYKGRVYMIKNGGLVSCMDANTGKLLYRERLGAAGPYYSSPVAANGRIYIASGKGIITVFAAGDTLDILAKNKIDESVLATPAVVDNRLYIRTVKHLYAFGR